MGPGGCGGGGGDVRRGGGWRGGGVRAAGRPVRRREDDLGGWFYVPASATAPVPAIVMSHGWSAVKEMWLDKYAEAFAEAGLLALVYDNRNLGASDGEPRQELDPFAQARDYRHAITYAGTLPEVDKTCIGIWG